MRTHEFQLDESEKELVQKVRDFEFKIFESLIHSRHMMMNYDYYSGESVPIIPTQWDYLIILSQQLQSEFDLLRVSQLAYQYSGLFESEVRLTLTRLADQIDNELCRNILAFRRNQWPYKQIYDSYTHYLKDVLNYVEANNKKSDSKEPLQTPQIEMKLSDIFDSISKYQYIMNLLVENQYCQPNTFIWKDSAKGNKGLLAAILKFLHTQKYYKDNKRPTPKQIKEIAQNTFGWKIMIDTIKKAKPQQFDLKFIPPASTLP